MTGATAPGAARPVTPVGLLAARLATLVERYDDDPDVRAAHDLAAGLDPYLAAVTTPESPDLARLAARTAERDWARRPSDAVYLEQEMLSGHVEGRFLAMLVRATRARHVLDMGMFTGYSALAMAEALPPEGRVIACEVDADVAAFATESFAEAEAGKRIEVRLGPAADTLAGLAAAGERFDLVFLDADKAGYLGYLHQLLETTLLADDGLICVDNTLMQGQPWTADPAPNGVAIAAFNDAVAADPRVEQVLVPLRDGMTLVRRASG